MKFGKKLIRVIDISNKEWSSKWMDYKSLKKLIKAIREADAGDRKKGHTRPDQGSIMRSEREREFFTLLRAELSKAGRHYEQMLTRFIAQANTLKERVKMLKPNDVVERKLLMGECTSFHKTLLLLENFSILNYCGFNKILKKHDAYSGYNTREKYMTKMVNNAPIANYTGLVALLKEVEQRFREISHNPMLSNGQTGQLSLPVLRPLSPRSPSPSSASTSASAASSLSTSPAHANSNSISPTTTNTTAASVSASTSASASVSISTSTISSASASAHTPSSASASVSAWNHGQKQQQPQQQQLQQQQQQVTGSRGSASNRTEPTVRGGGGGSS